ncbi:reverse transcriptase domain-containing protein [Phycisphaerales bacterium AB-hyl4]|uniref:Reverse transcriptase domain-containing protein n=1 Tax=Natronomicrosphaera hydrolytica TaxID=3242702 RepID=A0ABV4U993_9BACT
MILENISSSLRIAHETLPEFLEVYPSRFLPTRKEWDGRKVRIIDEPERELKRLQRTRLLRSFQRWGFHHPRAYAGPQGRNHVAAARQHLGAQWIINRDVYNAFPSVTPQMMHTELVSRGFRPEVVKALVTLFTLRGRIPQGSPLSNIALNLAFYRIDHQLSTLCGRLGLNYTRYADDINVSCAKSRRGRRVRIPDLCQEIESAIRSVGVEVNSNKKRKRGFQGLEKVKVVHGCMVSGDDYVLLAPNHETRLIALAEKYPRRAKSVSSEGLRLFWKKRSQLVGFAWCASQLDDRQLVKHVWQKIYLGDRILDNRLVRDGAIRAGERWFMMAIDGVVNRWMKVRRVHRPRALGLESVS